MSTVYVLQDYEFMRQGEQLAKFNRIIFNFPCVGLLDEQQLRIAQEKAAKKREVALRKGSKGKGPKDSRDQKPSSNTEALEKGRAEAAAKRAIADKKWEADKELIGGFFKCAKEHLAEDARIHVTLRTVQVCMHALHPPSPHPPHIK